MLAQFIVNINNNILFKNEKYRAIAKSGHMVTISN